MTQSCWKAVCNSMLSKAHGETYKASPPKCLVHMLLHVRRKWLWSSTGREEEGPVDDGLQRDGAEVEDADEHLLKIVTDSDHAGNKNDRKSTTSTQLYLDGNLIDRKVRSQKAIALSSAKSELLRHLWNQITGGVRKTKARSDSCCDTKAGHWASASYGRGNAVDPAEGEGQDHPGESHSH